MTQTNTIWTTEKVKESMDKLRLGEQIDSTCFHERDLDLRAQDIFFQLTHQEEDEFVKCSQNIEYFVENYCRFVTDYGRQTVVLRDFQEDILKTLGRETWIEKLQDFGPEVRNYILMASRQTGKCVSFDTKITIKNRISGKINEITIGNLYNLTLQSQNIKKLSFKQIVILKIKGFLYSIYKKL